MDDINQIQLYVYLNFSLYDFFGKFGFMLLLMDET